MTVLATSKKSEVGYILERTLVRCSKKQYIFQRIVLGAESALTVPNDVRSEKFNVLF